MESERATNLTFCTECGALRVRDVKDQLKKLFNEPSIEPNACGICKKALKVQSNATDKSSKQGHHTEVISDLNGSTDGDVKCENSLVDISLTETEPSALKCEETNEKVTHQAHDRKTANDFDPDYYGCHKKKTQPCTRKKITRLSTGAIKPAKYLAMQGPADSASDDDDDDGSNYGIKTEDSDHSDFDDTEQLSSSKENDSITDIKDKPSANTDEESASFSGTKSLDPELLELFVSTDNPKRPFQCKFCSKRPFAHLNNFQKHVISHTGKEPMVRPYKCDTCGKNFSSAYHLSRHRRLHNDKRLTCSFGQCHHTFNNRGAFKRHLKVHSGGGRHVKCKTCGQNFASKKRLEIHVTLHSDERPFSCEYCDKTFSHILYKKKHQTLHENLDGYKCEQCSYTCQSKGRLEEHVKSHVSTRVTCSICHHVFKYQFLLDRHSKGNKCKPPPEQELDIDVKTLDVVKGLHPEVLDMMGKAQSLEAPFRCKLCEDKDFCRPVMFMKHMRGVHQQGLEITKLFFCDLCDNKGFEMLTDFNTHKRCHSLERPFKCQHSGCEKAFKCRESLNAHQLVHKVRKHMCSICGSLFVSNSKLRLHEARVHMGFKPHKCVHCEKAFGTNGQRVRHESTVHLKLRPFVCEVCGLSFPDRKAMIVHNRSHTGEKPYACPHCEYRCVRSDYLKKHLMTHSGEKPHECTQCGMRFALRTTLVLHQRKCYPQVKIPISSTAVEALLTTGSTPCPNPGAFKIEKPYTCPHCEYQCVRSDDLKKHLMTHGAERPTYTYPNATVCTSSQQSSHELALATDNIAAILKYEQL